MITAGIGLLFASIITFSLFTVLLKVFAPKNLLPFLFWVNVVTYIGFLGIYFYRKYFLQHDLHILEELIFHFSFENAPLYILLSICFVGSYVIFNGLLEKYDVAQVMALSQISILFSFIGFLLMGDSFSLKGCIEVLIVTYGALISGMTTLSFNPYTLFASQSWDSIRKVFLYASFTSIITIITFLLTQQTVFNEEITGSLRHIFPFSFYNPFYFNVGTRFYIMITFFIYLWYKGYTNQLIPVLREKKMGLLITSLLFLATSYTFQLAFDLIPNRSLFSALYKFTNPCILLCGILLLKEKTTMPKIIGSLIIVLGGAIALWM